MQRTATERRRCRPRRAGPPGPNAHLVGCRDARSQLSTPALIVDLEALDGNIRALADHCRSAGVALRPHAKCHKSLAIARRQLAAGAAGLCCATIGEAEVLARGGIRNLLVTSPLTTSAKIERFCRLAPALDWLAVAVDHPANAAQLAAAGRQQRRPLRVLVDIDPGMQRTGVASTADCVALALECAHSDALVFEGVQCYAGAAQHIEGLAARRAAALAVLSRLRAIGAELRAAGCAPAIVSGSGTGSFDLDIQVPGLTELQPGSYVFLDNQYCQLEYAEARPVLARSLFVQAAVVSANHPGLVTVDAGLKHFAVDGGVPLVVRGAPLDAAYSYLGDEHGRLALASGQAGPALGARVEFGVPHCDPTVNLYDYYHCFRGDTLVDIWPVDARGC